MQVPWNFPFAISGLGEAQHQHCQRLHGEAPDDAESIQGRQLVNVNAAQNDCQQLHANDQVDDAKTCAVAVMRPLEPTRQHSVFGDAIQYAIRADDGSILGAGQNQHTNQYDEAVEQQLDALRPGQVHGEAADEISEVLRADAIGNHHHREERHEGSEEQAVDENYQPGLLKILQLGMLDFAVDLRQSFFAAHGEHGVAEADKCNDRDKRPEREMPEPGSV